VQLFTQGPQQLNQTPLHGEMHVFRLQTGPKLASGGLLAYGFEPFNQLVTLGPSDQSAAAQHARMGHGTLEILLQ
jgi:hypothetical protein